MSHESQGFVMSEIQVDSVIAWIACGIPIGVLKQNPGPTRWVSCFPEI